MQAGRLQARFRVAGYDDAPLRHGGGVELLPYLLRQGAAARQVQPRAVAARPGDVNVAGKVLRQMVGNAAPLVQQAGVYILLILDVGAAGAEKGFQRLRRQLFDRGVILAAQPEAGRQPLAVGVGPHRAGFLDGGFVFLDKRLQHRRGVDAQGHSADAFLRRQLVSGGLQGGDPDGRVRLLVRLGQHLARRHFPKLAVPLEIVRFPDLGNHRQRLLPHFPGIPRVNAHPQLFVGGGASGAELHPPVGKMVHHRHPLRHPDGMVVGQNHHAEAQADPLGEPRQGAENHFGAGRFGKGGQKVVFDKPHGVKPHLIGQDALFDGFLNNRVVVQHRPLHFISQRKLHHKPSQQS